MTNGEVPETIMTDSTANISHICEFGWYDWVMFRDNLPTFPYNKLILGRYLGPATNVGSALTAKIIKLNGQNVCRSTLRHLTNEETHCPIHLETRRVFAETVASHLGLNATDQDFLAEDLTPDFDHYDNDHDLDPNHGDLEVTPEVVDNFFNAEIFVPRVGTLLKGCVTARKRDKGGTPVGLANANPTFRLGGQLTFSIFYLHTQINTTFHIGITPKSTKILQKKPSFEACPSVTAPPPPLPPPLGAVLIKKIKKNYQKLKFEVGVP